jgi:hypothetical protein
MRAQRFGPPVMSWQALQQPLRQRRLHWHWLRRLCAGQADAGKGQPVPGGWTFRTSIRRSARKREMHDYLLMPVSRHRPAGLVLLIAVMAKFNRRANPVAPRPATTP